MSTILQPAKDGRLKWQRTTKTNWQLRALDGGTVGTVVHLVKQSRYSASTHRSYLGSFATEGEAKQAVEHRVEVECQ